MGIEESKTEYGVTRLAQRLDAQERALLDQVMRRGERGIEETEESKGLIRSMRNNIAQRR